MSFPPKYPYDGQYPQYNPNQQYGHGQVPEQQYFQGQAQYMPQQGFHPGQHQQQYQPQVQIQQQYRPHPQQQQYGYRPEQQLPQTASLQPHWSPGAAVNVPSPSMSSQFAAQQPGFPNQYVPQQFQQPQPGFHGNGMGSSPVMMQGQFQQMGSPHLGSPHLQQEQHVQRQSPHLQPSPHLQQQSPLLQHPGQRQSPHLQQQQQMHSPHLQQQRQSPHLSQQPRQSPQMQQQRHIQQPQAEPYHHEAPHAISSTTTSQPARPSSQSKTRKTSQAPKSTTQSPNVQPQTITSPGVQSPPAQQQQHPPQPQASSPKHSQNNQIQPALINEQSKESPLVQSQQEIRTHVQPQDLMKSQISQTPSLSEPQTIQPQSLQQQAVGSLQVDPPQFISMDLLMKEPSFDPAPPETDMRLLTMTLADECISEALKMKNDARLRNENYDFSMYEKLMTTGLRFLQGNIKEHTWLISPREEAVLQLRYAALMYEETENISDIEIVLNRGIKFCTENKLLDLQYSMQHLLVRTMIKSNAKIALKSLDDAIEEVTVSQHIPWIYAFRFLRAELVNTTWNQQTQRAAIKSLRAISDLAKEQKDSAVQVLACTQLAMLHLRLRESESVVEAQRALTEARSQQLSPQMESLPQLNAYLLTVDLVCELEPYKQANALPKAHALQQFLSSLPSLSNDQQASWADDDPRLHLPLYTTPEQLNLFMDTGGIFETSSTTGQTSLTLSWLSKSEILIWGSLLAASAEQSKTVQKESPDPGFTKDKLLQKALHSLDNCSDPPENADLVKCLIQMQQTFAYADRSDWSAANKHLLQFRDSLSQLPPLVAHKFRPYQSYLTGAIHHGSGDTTAAIMAYEDLFRHLGKNSNKGVVSVEDVLAILAGCSMLMIFSDVSHPEGHRVPEILEKLTPYFPEAANGAGTGNSAYTAQNPNIRSVHAFVISIFPPNHASSAPNSGSNSTNPSIIHTKQHLQSSLSFAKNTGNAQLLLLSLSYLCGRFFVGTTGEQTVKSMLAARDWARETRSKLWLSVCDGMLNEIMERQGRAQEAERWRSEGERAVSGMEASLRNAIGL